jgi:maleate isomerase
LRIGVLLPSPNVVAEGEINAMLPAGVSLHTTRLRLTGGSPEHLTRMADHVEAGAELLADANVDLIVFHCTAVSTYDVELEQRIKARIEAASGRPATTTAEALVAAFQALDARRTVLVSPYPQVLNQQETVFLARSQVTVISETGLNLPDAEAFAAVEPGQWYRHVKAARDDAADSYFLSCTAVRSALAIAPLERDLGKPVITSNQAMVWHALRRGGVQGSPRGFGQLFDRH